MTLIDLLTASEIVLILQLDPAWTLPRGTHRRNERMAEAVQLLKYGEPEKPWARAWTPIRAKTFKAAPVLLPIRLKRKVAA